MCLLLRKERKTQLCSPTFVRSFLQRSGYASSQTSFCVLALRPLWRKGQEYENNVVALRVCKIPVISAFLIDLLYQKKQRRLHYENILF